MASILVCDDAAFMRMTLIKILQGAGHDVIGEAANGIEALEKYRVLKPDVVMMDITMPERNGLEATKDITEYDPTGTVIMVSAMGLQSRFFSWLLQGFLLV